MRHERFDFHCGYGGFLFGERLVRARLRETIGGRMGSIIVGIIAFLLFAYLLVAMLYPEKF